MLLEDVDVFAWLTYCGSPTVNRERPEEMCLSWDLARDRGGPFPARIGEPDIDQAEIGWRSSHIYLAA